MRIQKVPLVRVDIDIADLPPEALARLDKIAAMSGLSRAETFACMVAMGVIDEALDRGDDPR